MRALCRIAQTRGQAPLPAHSARDLSPHRGERKEIAGPNGRGGEHFFLSPLGRGWGKGVGVRGFGD